MKLVQLLRCTGAALISSMLMATSALAGPWRITIDTAPIAGLSGFMALDFVAGSPATGNAAVVSAFSSNAALGVGTPAGDVTGSLGSRALTLGGGSFFNEWLQGVTRFGSRIEFNLDLGDRVGTGGRPDQFAFFLLDNGQLPFATDDPSGAGALFYFDLVGSAGTRPVVFSSSFARATLEPRGSQSGVPEPGTLLLVALALLCLLALTVGARPRSLAATAVC